MKRSFLLALAVPGALLLATLSPLPLGSALAAGNGDALQNTWDYDRFRHAVEESGRAFRVGPKGFARIQERKRNALPIIAEYLRGKFGEADPAVMNAFREVPREFFHYRYDYDKDFANSAYELEAKPWAIGYGSALSDYLGQAYMTQLAKPKPDDVVLEVGTGSGFQISLLSRMVKKAYSIEIIKPLGNSVSKVFKPLAYGNVETRVGDGYTGWPEVTGGFDIIMVTCAAQYVPPPLIAQLKPGGRMIIPIGQPFKRGQILYVYTKDKNGKVRSRKDVGVYFIPMTGTIMKKAKKTG